MTADALSSLAVQLLGGFASASSLFLVAAGLSLIFGVSRIVNFAHGGFFMLGAYTAYSLIATLSSTIGFWPSLLLAAMVVAMLGAVVEMLLLRRIYHAPELLQLLATFALGLIIKDAVLASWGPEELPGPRAPGLGGAVAILGRQFPAYDLFLMAAGPAVWALLWLLLHRTRWGILVRAATEDRAMASALGIRQAWLFTAVFALGCFLAGLGGALQLPRESAHLELDINAIGSAFAVVVIGGMGSVSGAFVAALLISQIKALCIWIGLVEIAGVEFSFSKLTLVVEFVVMAVVLVVRPWGLFGKPTVGNQQSSFAFEKPVFALPGLLLQGTKHHSSLRSGVVRSLPVLGVAGLLLALLLVPILNAADAPYTLVLLVDILTAALFAASLFFIAGPGGLHSFGHAAYFGLGAYGAALAVRQFGWPMEVALLLAPIAGGFAALVYGWFCVRLSGVYLSMLTLAFAQMSWALVYQADAVTGGSNGLTGIWPADWLADDRAYYSLVLGAVTLSVLLLYLILQAPFGLALRAVRDAPLRAEALGIERLRVQWLAFVIAGVFAGLAGGLYAFSKGSISPEVLHVNKSVDALAMVLLGGVQTIAGPLLGAAVFTGLHDTVARSTDYWRALLGGIIVLLTLAAPLGLAGVAGRIWQAIARRFYARDGAKGQL